MRITKRVKSFLKIN